MVLVKFLPRAEKDLLQLPEELQDEILHKTEMLARFPYLGQAMERAYSRYRCLLAGKNRYRIIYRVTSPELIEIAYIRHCSRQIGLRVVLPKE